MRILICASSLPLPPLNGFRLLLHALVRELGREHEVRVVGFRQPDQPMRWESIPQLRAVPTSSLAGVRRGARVPGALVRGEPVDTREVVTRLWPVVSDELERFQPDIVHATSGRVAALGPRITGAPRVLGAVDARHLNVLARAREATGLRRLALVDEARRIRSFIAAIYPAFDHVTVVTDADRAALHDIDPGLRITVVPNGVDTEHFRPIAPDHTEPRIAFTGSMGYAPNVAAARHLACEVLPAVRAQRPDASLVLAGRDPAPAVRALEAPPAVTVTGQVPDLRPWLVGSRVFAAPMRSGTGIKNKLLEAMACGLPCVVSPLSLQGLACRPGHDVLVADDTAATVDALLAVLDDDTLARTLGASARRYVEGNHSWASVRLEHEAIYHRLLGSRAAHGSPRDR